MSSKKPTYPILENLNCGEEEESISIYGAEEDARKARYFLSFLVDGVRLSIGSEETEFYGIFLASAFIYLPRNAYTESKAQQIADEIGGSFHSSFDEEFQNDVFNEIASDSANGGMTEAAEGCVASELMSNDAVSISFDAKGEEDADEDTLFSAFCLLKALAAPDNIFDSVMRTRALDGRIEESWGAFRAPWSYHPDSGTNMTVLFEE